MNAITFTNADFGDIRAFQRDEAIWFVGKDIAKHLGYNNTRKALSDHVDAEDKTDGVTIRDSIGRNQKAVIINESGLYSLILSSKLPTAKKFKRWVTSEVLPAIRKTGKYQEKKEPKPDYDKLGFYEIPMHVNKLVTNAVEGCREAYACFEVIESLLPSKYAEPIKCLVRRYGELMHYYQNCEDRALEECGYDNFHRYAAHYEGYLDFCEKSKK